MEGGFVRHAGQAARVRQNDFIVARDGKIAALYMFFDKLP
jgi:ketosteroid isomerase-like protein